MPARIIRDKSGRITSYSSKEAPSAQRMKDILRQAGKQGATRAGLVAEVSNFQGYEMKAGVPRIVRAFRKGDTPEALRSRISGPASMHATNFILQDVKNATGAEQVSGLRGFTLNFYYG